MQYFTDQVRFSFVCVFECILPFFRSQFLVVHNNTWAVSLLSNEQNSGNSDSVQCQIVGPCVSEGPSPLHLSPQRNHLQINNLVTLKCRKLVEKAIFLRECSMRIVMSTTQKSWCLTRQGTVILGFCCPKI